jgi:hypothetical protein
MRFNFKKITSVLASALMLGSTVGFAAAATYPAPFVQSGNANVGIVVGASAANTDYLAAINLGSKLSSELAKQTATTGSTGAGTSGEGVNLATTSRGIYYADSINAARPTLTENELPNVLTDGTFTDLTGTSYTYNQVVTMGDTVSTFGTSGGDLGDPVLYLDVGTTATDPLYNYTLSFNKNLNVSDSTNVQGQKINILGVDYIIGASSTNSSIYLYGSGETIVVSQDESQTVTVGDQDHIVELVTTSTTTSAKISVDGSTRTVTKGSSYTFPGEVVVYVKDVTHPSFQGDLRSAELIIGANSLKLANGQTVKEGSDETTVRGTKVTVDAADHGVISGFTVQISMERSREDHLAAGDAFTDPVFGGLSVQFAGSTPALDSEARGSIRIDTDNSRFAYVTFDSYRSGSVGEQEIAFAHDNTTSTSTVQPILAHDSTESDGKGFIHVVEGENARLGDWIVINQQDAGTIVEVSDLLVDTATAGKVFLRDVITNEEISGGIAVTNNSAAYQKTANIFGGNSYSVQLAQDESSVNITWDASGSATTVFPRIKLRDGGWIALLTEVSLPNSTSVILPDGLTTIATSGTSVGVSNDTGTIYNNGINWTMRDGPQVIIDGIDIDNDGTADCNFNSTRGPAVLFIEPKKWDDSSYGDFICVPLTTEGTTTVEIGISDPVFMGTNSGFVTLESDNNLKHAVDKYGAYAEKEETENNVATITYPASQMFLDILVTEEGATVTSGSSGTGSVEELGSVAYRDNEISSIQERNLIVVGGSCINSVAAKVLDVAEGTCGSAFTEATGVGADQFLIKVIDSPYTDGRVAMLVAGYEAADTTKAVEYVTMEKPTTDVGTELKKVTATYADVE